MTDTLRAVDMTVFMDDVPEGSADEAVNAGRPAGDCLRACVATILGLDLLEVPHFVQYVEHPAGTDVYLWWWALVGFCFQHGRRVSYHRYQEGAPDGWSVVAGLSLRGHQHVCVALDGEIVHDPHPSRAGLELTSGWFVFQPVSECWPQLGAA